LIPAETMPALIAPMIWAATNARATEPVPPDTEGPPRNTGAMVFSRNPLPVIGRKYEPQNEVSSRQKLR
jgi:hypothetical protein